MTGGYFKVVFELFQITQRHRMDRCRWWAPRNFRPRTHVHKLIPAWGKTNQREEMRSNSCLSDWLSLRPNCTFNKWLALSRSGPRHKRTTQVCVREVITAFHCFFFSPLAPFTHKSRATDTPEQWNHTNAQGEKKTQHGRTQGAWESFWPLAREKGGALTLWGEKKNFSWVRLKKIQKHSKPKYQLIVVRFCLLFF